MFKKYILNCFGVVLSLLSYKIYLFPFLFFNFIKNKCFRFSLFKKKHVLKLYAK